MEDHRIDMILPDGTNLSLPVQPFTLIGATTQAERLSAPLKNRFIYNFSFSHYNQEEKQRILAHYLGYYNITYTKEDLIPHMATKIDTVPREIKNLCTKLRDYLISSTINPKDNTLPINHTSRSTFVAWLELEDHGITHLHKQYLAILQGSNNPI
jgi:Holliday junction DNA helicase RuvB